MDKATRSGDVQSYLENLLASPLFSAAPRRGRLLKDLVDRTLAGEGDRVGEYSNRPRWI